MASKRPKPKRAKASKRRRVSNAETGSALKKPRNSGLKGLATVPDLMADLGQPGKTSSEAEVAALRTEIERLRRALVIAGTNNHLARHEGSALDWETCPSTSCADVRAALAGGPTSG